MKAKILRRVPAGTKRRFSVALDYDDTVVYCMGPALAVYEKKTGHKIPIYDMTKWRDGDDALSQHLNETFSNDDFVRNVQQPIEGAQSFVRELLQRGCDVLITTAVPMCVADARAASIRKHFPDIKPENIIIGKRKDVYDVDVMIDDAPHNILNSRAKYPILMRKPWNQNVTGLMAANNFEECLNLIDTIMRQNGYAESPEPTDVICLVGPSGSGKHDIINALRGEGYIVPRIFTTNPAVTQDFYRIVDKSAFEQEKEAHHYAETTSYAGYYYGIRMEDMVEHMAARRRKRIRLVIPIDICGANALKRIYGECVKTVYVHRGRDELVMNILQKNIPAEEKTLRILALDGEERNEELCDYSIMNTSVEEASAQIKAID